jgi:hypothetical protein
VSTNAGQPVSSLTGRAAQPERSAPQSLPRVALVTALAAVVANLALWAVARGPLGVSPAFPPLQSAAATVVAGVVGILAATAAFALIRRLAPRPVAAFRVVAVVALLLSLGGPMSARAEPGGSGGAVAVLVAMHVVTAVIAVGFLPRAAWEG